MMESFSEVSKIYALIGQRACATWKVLAASAQNSPIQLDRGNLAPIRAAQTGMPLAVPLVASLCDCPVNQPLLQFAMKLKPGLW